MAYRIKKEFQGVDTLRTALKGGKSVALNKAHKKTVRGTPTTPPHEIDIPLATQEELKQLFEAGNRCVEKYEYQEPRNLVAEHEIKNPFDDDEAAEEEPTDDEPIKGKKKK